MDEHALRVIEFDRVLARLARLAAFAGGRELALNLQPATNYEGVLEEQHKLAEALRFRQFRSPLSLSDADEIRPTLEKAALDGSLDAQELLAVAATQRAAERARTTLTRVAGSLPRLGKLGSQLTELPEIVNEIGRSLDQRGEVLDAASPALALLRRDIKISHDRIHSRLQDFLNSPAGRLAAQEPIVTLRDGRYVIPIKADFRGEVKGIVHDVSSSGATAFVEPLAVVELANQWRELQIEERHEIERILRRLSGLVGEKAEALTANVGQLAQLDLLLAKAALAEELSSNDRPCLPDDEPGHDPATWLTRPGNGLRLQEARHPLLADPVPVTIALEEDDRVLLVTGPNTGGKTVALKNVGLICAMAQAGLPVPAAPGSWLPVFKEILADIGDEQSIEQSLSTFSGHLKNVVELLAKAGPESLVLLDELAAGTDPAEGTALARALLLELQDRGGLTIATTHHGELKLFAHAQPGVVNAAVEFDTETLAPTYKVTLGVPGRSNALAIAARLGLPEAILEAARQSLAPDQVAIDSLLSELRDERQAAAAAREAEEKARRRAETARGQAEQRLAGIDDEKTRRLDQAAQALEIEVETARDALQRAERAVQRSAEAADLPQMRQAVSEADETAEKLRRRSRRKRTSRPRTEEMQAGAQVWLEGIPMAAEVLSAPDARGELNVSFGGLRARVAVDQILRVEGPPKLAPERVVLPPAPIAAEQIEVRGQTLDDALPKVEQFLDDGFRAGVPRLRVVHGKGSGKMRHAVRALLDRHPLVRGYSFAEPAEGGEGVTVAMMALGSADEPRAAQEDLLSLP